MFSFLFIVYPCPYCRNADPARQVCGVQRLMCQAVHPTPESKTVEYPQQPPPGNATRRAQGKGDDTQFPSYICSFQELSTLCLGVGDASRRLTPPIPCQLVGDINMYVDIQTAVDRPLSDRWATVRQLLRDCSATVGQRLAVVCKTTTMHTMRQSNALSLIHTEQRQDDVILYLLAVPS